MDIICLNSKGSQECFQLASPSRTLVSRGFSWWSLGCDVCFGQAAVNNEVGRVNETTLVTGEEDHCSGLLYSLAETPRGKVNFPAESLFFIVTKPVLQQWCATAVST